MVDQETLVSSRILIVDDKQVNIEILEGLLVQQGYLNLKTTTDPRMVMDLISTFDPDLVLLDLMMPYISGYEILETLRTSLPSDIFRPVLVLTADISQEAKKRALNSGASDFLSKPFDLVEVGLRIRNLLRIRHLTLRMSQQNMILEEKVKERTLTLEQSNRDLSLAKEKAEAADKIKTGFIHMISHEIRTPLNGIIGFGNLLTEPGLSQQEKNIFLEQMTASSTRLTQTITDYLDISLITAGSMEVDRKLTSPEKLLKGLKSKFRHVCERKHIALDLIVPSGNEGIPIDTDPELLEKIMGHLLDNAVKFTEAGTINFGYSVETGTITFFVKDTGIGINQQDRERIFERFNQVDLTLSRLHEGSGLGLSIIRGITSLLGGEINFTSEPAKGSTFYVTLPIKRPVTG